MVSIRNKKDEMITTQAPKGGFTVVYVPVPGDPTKAVMALAMCSPSDHYNKKCGRGRAYSRALQALEKGQVIDALSYQDALSQAERMVAESLAEHEKSSEERIEKRQQKEWNEYDYGIAMLKSAVFSYSNVTSDNLK
jgi:hypothetical protein